jgi:hypothetical protein
LKQGHGRPLGQAEFGTKDMGAVPYQNDAAHSAWEAGLQSNIKMLKISGSPSNLHQSCASFQAGGYARISD